MNLDKLVKTCSVYPFSYVIKEKDWNKICKQLKEKEDTENRIIKGLADSRKFLKTFSKPFSVEGKALITFADLVTSIKALAVQNEICTLKWVLDINDSCLNCYLKGEDNE